ncbi:S1 family peptidase [Cupriavidus plantarum]|uniref:S1 family peptidase n=1 Tax=Cupriavidus plantarum TaxID=942865 RepID=UPI00339D319C
MTRFIYSHRLGMSHRTPPLAALATFATLAFTATHASAIGLDQITGNVYAVRAVGAQGNAIGTGSGVLTGQNQIVTACNVLAGARTIAVVRENVSYEATLAAPDVERNLCLLKVPNLPGAGATLAAGNTAPSLGQKMVLASAAGSAVAVRESVVTGLQAGADNKLASIELSAAQDGAASGGAVFDDAGRLVGILVSGTGNPPPRQRAVPAAWVRDIGTRGAAALASYLPSANDTAGVLRAAGLGTPASAAPGTTAAGQPATDGSPRVGEVWQYLLTDNLTRRQSEVRYRVDRLDGDRVIFNQGGRIERTNGMLERIVTPAGGDFDAASPPTGWVPDGVRVGQRWKYSYRQPGTGFQTDIEGNAGSESEISTPAGRYRTIRIAYRGYVQRTINGGGGTTSHAYTATAWYAPDIHRVVRFQMNSAQTAETLELAAHRFE